MAYTDAGSSEMNDDLFDLRMSDEARPLYDHVKKFIADVVDPMSVKFHELGKGHKDIWTYAPGQLDTLEEAKDAEVSSSEAILDVEEKAKEVQATETLLATSQTNADDKTPTFATQAPKAHLSAAARERWEDLAALFARHELTDPAEFDNPNSSPYKALDWLIEYDTAMDYLSSDQSTQLLENYALLVFYFATHPEARARDARTFTIATQAKTYDPNKDWIHHAATKHCQWDGVHCSHNDDRVVVLNLTQHELGGTLPMELKALEHLIEVDVSHNRIGGTVPAEYGRLERLRLVDMADNQLEGDFPDQAWANLKKLESIDFRMNPGLKGEIPQL